MKRLALILTGVFAVNAIFAQHVITQMNIHLAEGG